jgi:predicted PurR-regulated permease PerM
MLFGATFLDFLWSIIIIFFMIAFFLILFHVIVDVLRRDDASGWKKAAWILFMVFLPFLGILSYLIINHEGMTRRSVREVQRSQEDFDSYVKSVAGPGDPVSQIAKAKDLLDQGTISQAEFDSLKAKALSA